MKNKESRLVISVELSKDQWKWIDKISKKINESKGSCIRAAIQAMIRTEEEKDDKS